MATNHLATGQADSSAAMESSEVSHSLSSCIEPSDCSDVSPSISSGSESELDDDDYSTSIDEPPDISNVSMNVSVMQRMQAAFVSYFDYNATKYLNEIDAISSSISGLDKTDRVISLTQLKNALKGLRLEFTAINGAVQTTARNSLKLGEALSQAFQKFPIWLGTAGVVMGIVNRKHRDYFCSIL